MDSPAFSRGQAAVEDRLRAAGLPDYQSLMQERMDELEAENPGRLEPDVEAGKAKVPGVERFREALEHAVRIAQIHVGRSGRHPDDDGEHKLRQLGQS